MLNSAVSNIEYSSLVLRLSVHTFPTRILLDHTEAIATMLSLASQCLQSDEFIAL